MSEATGDHLDALSYFSNKPLVVASIKTIPQDFVVREISLDGEVAYHRQIQCSETRKTDFQSDVAEEQTLTLDYDMAREILQILGETSVLLLTMVEKFAQLDLKQRIQIARHGETYSRTRSNGHCPPQLREYTIQFAAPDDRATRGKYHEAIRNAFNGICTSFYAEGSFVVVPAKPSLIPLPKRQGKKTLRFILYKEQRTVQAALGAVARKLTEAGVRLPPNAFSTAGMKDQKGITTQWVSVSGPSPEAFQRAAELLEEENEQKLGRGERGLIGVSQWSEGSSVFLGGLKGNQFTIVLRNAMGMNGPITASEVDSLQVALAKCIIAFPNYFGEQRFGTGEIPTHVVGAAIASRSWVEAVRLIVLSNNGLPGSRTREACDKFLREWDPQSILDEYAGLQDNDSGLPTILISLFKALSKNASTIYSSGDKLKAMPGPHHAAVASLPSSRLSLFIHAFQSYLFNMCLSRRLALDSGMRVVAGDVVLEEVPQSNEDLRKEHRVGDSGTRVGKPHVITAEEANSPQCKWTLADVVIPLYVNGNDVCDGVVRETLMEELQKIDFNFDAGILGKIRGSEDEPGNPREGPTVSLASRTELHQFGIQSGLYRPALQHFLEGFPVRANLFTYQERTPLLPIWDTDVPCPHNIPKYVKLFNSDETTPAPNSVLSELEITEGDLVGISFEFSLPSSTYATVLLRELFQLSQKSFHVNQTNNQLQSFAFFRLLVFVYRGDDIF